ncbi:9360_t:CDS:1, partial [Ambispora gerdemannii]
MWLLPFEATLVDNGGCGEGAGIASDKAKRRITMIKTIPTSFLK